MSTLKRKHVKKRVKLSCMFKRKPCDVLTIVTSDFDMINKNIGQKCLFSFVNCKPIRTEQNHFSIVKYDKKKAITMLMK